MDEKKLAALHSHFTGLGVKLPSQKDFINSMKDERNAKDFFDTFDAQGAFDVDYDTFKSIYGIGATPVTDWNANNASEIQKVAKKPAPVAQTPMVDYNAGIVEDIKKSREGLGEKPLINTYQKEVNKVDTPIFADQYATQYPQDVVGEGMQQRDKREAQVKSLLANAKQETTLGVAINPVNLPAKVNPNAVSDIGFEALKYAQQKELPNEIRDAIIEGDDKVVSNYLVRNDDNFRLKYADEQDLAQAEKAFGKKISPKERMQFWEGMTNYYAESDKKLYKENAEWLSPYTLLKEGNNENFDQILKKIAPNFEQTPETPQQTSAKIEKEIANLGSFNTPEERLMAYYQILANRQRLLQENMFNSAKSVQPENIQKSYEKNKGNVIADIITSAQVTSGLANLAAGLPLGAGLVVSPLVRNLVTEDQKEWFENAKKLNAVAKYLKEGGANQEGGGIWENLKGKASDIIPAFQRNAFGMLDIPTTADTRAGIAGTQRGVLGQINAKPTAAELNDLKQQQSLAQGLTSAEMWAGTAGTQLGIGAILFGARNAGAGKVSEVAQGLTNVDKYSKLGKALFSNTASSKALNKLYGLTVSAIGTGLEYEAAGVLSGQDSDSELRKEMSFGSGAAGALGKWFAAPLLNKLSGAKRAIANRLSGTVGEMSEESLQTVYQNWQEFGTNGVLDETLRQVVGEKDASLLDKINNATGFIVSIAVLGALDGDNSQELHNIKSIIPTIEQITGEKVDENAINQIMNGMEEGVKDKPTGVKITDNGVDFKINGKEFSYTENSGAQSEQSATQQELELADNYGRQIVELNTQPNETQQSPAISQPQETLEAQTNETIAPTDQNQGENAQVIQEVPQVGTEQAVEQPTAEQLDARLATIAQRVKELTMLAEKEILGQEIKALQLKETEQNLIPPISRELEPVENLQVSESVTETPQIEKGATAENKITFESAKEGDIVMLNGEEFEVISKKKSRRGNDVVEIKKIGKRTKEEIKKAAINTVRNRVRGQYKKEQTDAEIEKNHFAMVMKEVQDETAAENSNTGIITIDKGQWEKEVSSKKEPTEKPIAETPQAEKKVVEKEGNEIEFGKLYNDNEKVLTKESREKSKNHNNNLQKQFENELKDGDTIISASGEELYYKDGVVLWKKDGTKYGMTDVPTMAILNGSGNAKIIHNPTKSIEEIAPLLAEKKEQRLAETPKNENEITEKEKTTEKPVAPAAPQEQKPAPQKTEQPKKKSLKEQLAEKREKNKPKQKTREIRKRQEFADFLYEMSDKTPEDKVMAEHTAQIYEEAAKAWAKSTGKSVRDWWNRIESITIGGEGEMGSVQKTADNTFKVFLLTSRDVSTPLHELSHIFQNDLSEAQKETVVKWINDTYNKNFSASQWVWEGGTDKSLTPESREISELFAKGFEQYLKEGSKVSDKKMQSIFDSFAEWLKEVYQTAIEYFGANIVLNDDMRSLYDAMLGQDKEFSQRVKTQSRLQKLVDEGATNPEQVVWNYFAKGGQINTQDVIDRFNAAKRGKPPINAAYISDKAKTKQQIAKDLYDSQVGEKQFDESDFFGAIDAVVDEMGAGFSKTVEAKIKEYAAAKNQNQDEEAINAEAEALIEEERRNRENKPSKDELLRMQYQNEIDEAIFGGNSLMQTPDYQKKLDEFEKEIKDLVSDIDAKDATEDEIKEAVDYLMQEFENNGISENDKLEIINTAISKALNPPTEAKADATQELQINDQVREIVAKLNENPTQENEDKANEKIDELLDNSMLSNSQKEAIRDRNKIRERQFGAKFRDKYSAPLGDAIRENVLSKTYFYDNLKDDIALAQSKAQMELFLNDAIEEVADEWYNDGKITDKNQKTVADSDAFYSAVLEKLVDIALNDLAKVSDITTYWQKAGTTMYAVRLASEVSKQLHEKNTADSREQAKRLADKVGIAVNSLAEAGTGGGRLSNMFKLFNVITNMNGDLVKDYVSNMMEGIYGKVTAKKKEIKEIAENVLSATEDIVQDLASGKDSELLNKIMEAVAKNPKVETLINSILNRANTLEDLQEQIDISEEAEIVSLALRQAIKEKNEVNTKLVAAKKELNSRNTALKNAKKRNDELTERIRVLEVQIARGGANVESLKKKLEAAKADLSSAKTQLNAADNENKKSMRTNDSLRKEIDELESRIKNLKEQRKGVGSQTNEAKAERKAKQAAKRSKGKTAVSNALSKLLKYKGDNSLYQTKIGSKNLASVYSAAVIRDVNNAIKTMADFFYEDTKTHTNSAKFYDDFIVYAKAELAKMPINATLAADIVTNLDNRDFADTIEPYIQERINKDYTNNIRKRVIGLNSTITDPTKKRKEIRQVLGELVMKAATATAEEKVNIDSLIKQVFGITNTQNIADFTQEFDKQFRELVVDKQKQLIAKRLLTDAERKGKTDAEIGKALLNKLEKQGHHKFLDNFAKDIRITAPNWNNDSAKRLSETYEVSINSPAQIKAIDDLLKIADKMPDGILKEKAMHNVMVKFVEMVNFSNARKWRATANEIKHFNRLSGSTHLQNIGDTVNKLISLFWGTIIPERLTLNVIYQIADKFGMGDKLPKNAKDTYIRQLTGFSAMLKDARKIAWNRFNLAEARYQHEFESVIDFYEKNLAELNPNLRNISRNRPIRAFFQRLYLGKIFGGKSLAVGNRAIMEAFDVWGQYTLNMQEQAAMLNRMGVPEDVILRELNLDKTNIPQIQSVIDEEINERFYEKDSRLEVVRRQELLANYLQEKYATAELGKRYGLGMTYKLAPAGDFAGFAYATIQAAVNKLRQLENFALNNYEAKGGAALGTIYHTTSVVTKIINALDYSRTMLNVFNWLIDWDLTVSTLRLAKNYAISDVLFGENDKTWERHHSAVYDSKTQKEKISSVEFVNIAAEVHKIDMAIEDIDRQINQYTNDAEAKRKSQNERTAAKIASINKRNIDQTEKNRLTAAVTRESKSTLANIDNVESRAKKPLQDTKAQLEKNRIATVAAYQSALSRKRGQIARNAIIYAFGITSLLLNAGADDDDEDPLIDIIGSAPEGKIQLAKELNIEETAAKNIFVFRYGRLLSKPTNDVFSYGFTDTPFLIPFSIFGGINDQIKRVRYGKDGGKMEWINSVTQSALDIGHQILSFRGLEMLSEATDPKTDNMTALTNLWQAMSPYSVPAIIKQPLSDIQGAPTYRTDKNAEGYVAAEFMRMFGLDRAVINGVIGTDVFAQQYSPLDGRPIRSWTNKDKLELGRFIFDAFHEGKEKSIKSLNQILSIFQKDDFVQYLVYKGWLHKTGIAEKVGLSTIDNAVPVIENGKIVSMNPIPESDFQKFIVKEAGQDFEKIMIRMYNEKKYTLDFPKTPKGTPISDKTFPLDKTPKKLIQMAKSGDLDRPADKVFISEMASKSDITAFNLAVQEVAYRLMEAQKEKYAKEYLKMHPEYKQLGESLSHYKKRIEKK